ncbi:MAG: sigma 54-interacting transcriptional regulator [Campylobacteraceae bacterium]|mgnify:FL=1|jgi:DNA-binding NtrC family response regulator|nr:sigma 54-interacting transcriptional regulator [Campylobacteraceae bacterium]MBT3883055.1 sigma 54-interacting transcriptional regulator [Campylobacteraceae bacterium]MBT4030715.1 sigma 54-interacting transcriptional regulator [Campylobacteraceae bacterium]MBT4178596.1 sigma 54-interacting transcriptional regulator [Campylobacteraceae bacterium]MBT4572686.1 sigma 54-interacting transcriptional regulator [Campylobacteraceae bacterium]
MEKFISSSPSTKKILKVAQMSASLPVNVMIIGQSGVGKKLLAKEIDPEAHSFFARDLEKILIDKAINLEEHSVIIIYNIHTVLNKNEFIERLKGVKIIATTFDSIEEYNSEFAVKIEIPSLEQRPEDLDELIYKYIKEASNIYSSSISRDDIRIDLSGNGITLKQSIFKSILLKSISKPEMMDTLNDFCQRELKNGSDYKKLLEIFEIPLLKAARNVFKSQLQMATHLKINRITLRKKLNKYFGE